MSLSPQVTPIDRFHAAVVAAHDAIKQAGYTPQVFEDNFYDPVDYPHRPDSWHYYKQRSSSGGLLLACAADINVLADQATENRVLNTVVVPIMKRYGVAFIMAANTSVYIDGHTGANQHLHCDVGSYGNTTGRDVRQPWAGVPTISTPAASSSNDQFDGIFGPATKRALQEALNSHGAKLTVDGVFGPESTTALQRYLKGKVDNNLILDGKWGALTTNALQKYLGTPVDGVISSPRSTAIMALQRRLAAKTF